MPVIAAFLALVFFAAFLLAPIGVLILWQRERRHAAAIAELRARLNTIDLELLKRERPRIAPRAEAPPVASERAASPEAKPAPVSEPAAAAPDLKVGPTYEPAAKPEPVVKPAPVVTPAPIVTPEPIDAPEPAAAHATAVSSHTAASLETQIGSRWLLYVGIVAVLVGVAYFEKLAFDNHWVGETARVIQGGLVGVLLVWGGLRFVRSGYRFYGQMLVGGGVAIEYVSIFAAFNFYHLIDRYPAFALLLLVTVAAAWLADRYDSQGLALMAVGGGFITPFLLPGPTDAQIALFGYDGILIAGTMYLASRRSWPWLNVTSYLFTLLTVNAWALRFYAPSKYLTTEMFLTVYCAMYVVILVNRRRSSEVSDVFAHFVLASAPLFYYIASLALLRPHPIALLVFTLALTVTGMMVSARLKGTVSASARLATWLLAYVPLALWVANYAGRIWLWPGLTAILAVYLIQLVVNVDAASNDDRTSRDGKLWTHAADLAALHLNALSAFGLAYGLVNVTYPRTIPLIAVGFAVWQLAVALRLSSKARDHALHFVALAATFLAIAIGRQFHGAWITMGWAVEGAVVIGLGLREQRNWLRVAGAALMTIAALGLFSLQFSPRPADEMAIFNSKTACGLVIVALVYWIAWLHQQRNEQGVYSGEVSAALIAAQLVTLAMVTSEVNVYTAAGSDRRWVLRDALHVLSWAAIGSAILTIGIRRAESWTRAIGWLLLAIGVVRLVALELNLSAASRVVLANPRAIAAVMVVVMLYGLAAAYRRLLAGGDDAVTEARAAIGTLVVGANLLTLLMLTSEVTAYWRLRDVQSFAQGMLLSIIWAIYATGLIVVGIRRHYAPIRYLAMLVFAVTIAKVFLVDMSELDQIYRVLSVIGLGVTLLVTSYLYHRFGRGLAQDES